MIKTDHLAVHLYATPNCNLPCKHCYYEAWPMDQEPVGLLTLGEISDCLIALCDSFSADIEVEGGEVFLRKDIPQLFPLVPTHYWKNVTFTTHGAAKIKVDYKDLQKLGDLRVSVEGHTDKVQQEIRGITLKPVMDNCLDLLSHNVPVTLRVTIHRENYADIAKLIKHFIKLGFKSFSFFEFQEVGRGKSYGENYSLSEAQFLYVLDTLCEEDSAKTTGIKFSVSARRAPIIESYRLKFLRNGYQVDNISGRPSLTVNFNGDIGVCPWNVGREKLTNIREINFPEDIINFARTGLLDHKCQYCSSIRVMKNAVVPEPSYS